MVFIMRGGGINILIERLSEYVFYILDRILKF